MERQNPILRICHPLTCWHKHTKIDVFCASLGGGVKCLILGTGRPYFGGGLVFWYIIRANAPYCPEISKKNESTPIFGVLEQCQILAFLFRTPKIGEISIFMKCLGNKRHLPKLYEHTFPAPKYWGSTPKIELTTSKTLNVKKPFTWVECLCSHQFFSLFRLFRKYISVQKAYCNFEQ